MKESEQITYTNRSPSEILQDIERLTALRRICWIAQNGQAPLIDAQLDRLWAERRAALCQAKPINGMGRPTNHEERHTKWD